MKKCKVFFYNEEMQKFTLIEHGEECENFFEKAKGLLGKKNIAENYFSPKRRILLSED